MLHSNGKCVLLCFLTLLPTTLLANAGLTPSATDYRTLQTEFCGTVLTPEQIAYELSLREQGIDPVLSAN